MYKKDVFISYRRDGGQETAKHLFDLLSRDYYRVAFDIDTLRAGMFDENIYKIIDECTDFIVILSKGSLERCSNEGDWVKLEIEYALKKSKNIVPIELSGFNRDEEYRFLPSDISEFKRCNTISCPIGYFDDFYRKLKERWLKSIPPPTSPTSPTTTKINETAYDMYDLGLCIGILTILASEEMKKMNLDVFIPQFNGAIELIDKYELFSLKDYFKINLAYDLFNPAINQKVTSVFVEEIKKKLNKKYAAIFSFGHIQPLMLLKLKHENYSKMLTSLGIYSELQKKLIKMGQDALVRKKIILKLIRTENQKICYDYFHAYIDNINICHQCGCMTLSQKKCGDCGTKLK